MGDWACAACGCGMVPRERVGRRDTCPECGAELRSCRQCALRDPTAYNQCAEPQAEGVLEKDRANFCEYYTPRPANRVPTEDKGRPGVAGPKADQSARANLEALFRKK